jgi:hypothetical protein
MTGRRPAAAGLYQARRLVRFTVRPAAWHPDDDGEPAPAPRDDEQPLPTAA